MIYESIDAFRKNATEDDIQELRDFIQAQKNKKEAFPCEKYNFSYTAASMFLKDTKDKNDNKDDNIGFAIGMLGTKEFVSRSVVLQTDICDRLDNLSKDYWQYSKKAIINKLLDEALAKYGY